MLSVSPVPGPSALEKDPSSVKLLSTPVTQATPPTCKSCHSQQHVGGRELLKSSAALIQSHRAREQDALFMGSRCQEREAALLSQASEAQKSPYLG